MACTVKYILKRQLKYDKTRALAFQNISKLETPLKMIGIFTYNHDHTCFRLLLNVCTRVHKLQQKSSEE